MFKKKCLLPPRPQLPSQNEMVADIMAMNDKDPLLSGCQPGSTTQSAEASETAYQKLKAFLELNHDLSETSNELNNLCSNASADVETLRKLGIELKTRADNVLTRL